MTQAAIEVVYSLLATVGIAGVLGFATATALIQAFKRHLVPDYLQSSVLLAAVLANYTLSNLIQAEAGLATVTVLGIILANQKSVSISHLVEFKENLGVLLISVLFILLASRYQFLELLELGWQGGLFLLLLIFLIRPLSVLLSTRGTNLKRNERIFLSFLAPRGIVAAAVSSVFALEFSHLATSDLAIDASVLTEVEKLVPLTFLVIVGTVSFYSLTAGPLARSLGISEQNPQEFYLRGLIVLFGRLPWSCGRKAFGRCWSIPTTATLPPRACRGSPPRTPACWRNTRAISSIWRAWDDSSP